MQLVVSLARFRVCNSGHPFLAALPVFKYLIIVNDRKLTFEGGLQRFGGSVVAQLSVYLDSSWAMCPTYRKPHSCNVLCLYGQLVAWCTHNQPIVAASSTETEYIEVSDAYKEGSTTSLASLCRLTSPCMYIWTPWEPHSWLTIS